MIINDYLVKTRPYGWGEAVPVIYRRRRRLGFLWRPKLAEMTGLTKSMSTVQWMSPTEMKDWFTRSIHAYEDHKARWEKFEAETAKLRRAGKTYGSSP